MVWLLASRKHGLLCDEHTILKLLLKREPKWSGYNAIEFLFLDVKKSIVLRCILEQLRFR